MSLLRGVSVVSCLFYAMAMLKDGFQGLAMLGQKPEALGAVLFGTSLGVGFNLMLLLVGVKIFQAAGEAKELVNHRAAVVACALALVPCMVHFVLWPFAAVFAIWGLVVLQRPSVKAAFS